MSLDNIYFAFYIFLLLVACLSKWELYLQSSYVWRWQSWPGVFHWQHTGKISMMHCIHYDHQHYRLFYVQRCTALTSNHENWVVVSNHNPTDTCIICVQIICACIYSFFYYVVENTANQLASNIHYIQLSHQARRVCCIDCLGHCVIYGIYIKRLARIPKNTLKWY